MNGCVRKQLKKKSNPSFYLKKPEKEKQIFPQERKQWGKKEKKRKKTEKQQREINEVKSWKISTKLMIF